MIPKWVSGDGHTWKSLNWDSKSDLCPAEEDCETNGTAGIVEKSGQDEESWRSREQTETAKTEKAEKPLGGNENFDTGSKTKICEISKTKN